MFPLPYTTWVLLIPSHDMGRFFCCPETCCGEQDWAPSGWSRKAQAVHSHDLPQPVEITVCTRAWRVTERFHVHTAAAAAQLSCASEMGKECLWPEAPECCYHRKNLKRYVSIVFSSQSWFQMKLLGISACTTFADIGKHLFLTWHMLNRKKTPRGSLGIRLPNVLGLLESTEGKYK